MKAILFGAAACVLLCGCKKPEAAADTPAPVPPGAAAAGPGGGITPVGPNVGSITPVVGDVGGTTGGGIAQGMKERARNSANSATTAPAGENGSGD